MKIPRSYTADETHPPIPGVFRWRDAGTFGGWNSIDYVQKASSSLIITLGFLLKATPNEVMIGTTISDQKRTLEPMIIPREWLQTFTRLPRRYFRCPK